jgi:hypothetical protein
MAASKAYMKVGIRGSYQLFTFLQRLHRIRMWALMLYSSCEKAGGITTDRASGVENIAPPSV